MKRDAERTVQALINAAEKLMTECDDPSEVTARAITKEAGVNLAMINYFFGSREELLFNVFEKLKQDAMDSDSSLEEIISGDLSPKDKLIEIHIKSISLMLDNYNLCRAITKYILINRSIQADRGSLRFITEHFGERKSINECRLIAFEISSLHELAVLRHEELRELGIELADKEVLRRFVTDNINRYLGE